jgi:2-polyprenyl-6-methoxyphenol hydroxylase-like FAD-dependent oxidoreductase
MCAADKRCIAVVGAGIGGLTLAIALRRYGISVLIYEQTAELREVGAAVALSANATRFFEQFGLTHQLASRCIRRLSPRAAKQHILSRQRTPSLAALTATLRRYIRV